MAFTRVVKSDLPYCSTRHDPHWDFPSNRLWHLAESVDGVLLAGSSLGLWHTCKTLDPNGIRRLEPVDTEWLGGQFWRMVVI